MITTERIMVEEGRLLVFTDGKWEEMPLKDVNAIIAHDGTFTIYTGDETPQYSGPILVVPMIRVPSCNGGGEYPYCENVVFKYVMAYKPKLSPQQEQQQEHQQPPPEGGEGAVEGEDVDALRQALRKTRKDAVAVLDRGTYYAIRSKYAQGVFIVFKDSKPVDAEVGIKNIVVTRDGVHTIKEVVDKGKYLEVHV